MGKRASSSMLTDLKAATPALPAPPILLLPLLGEGVLTRPDRSYVSAGHKKQIGRQTQTHTHTQDRNDDHNKARVKVRSLLQLFNEQLLINYLVTPGLLSGCSSKEQILFTLYTYIRWVGGVSRNRVWVRSSLAPPLLFEQQNNFDVQILYLSRVQCSRLVGATRTEGSCSENKPSASTEEMGKSSARPQQAGRLAS